MSIHKGILETKTGNNTSDILYPKTSIDQVVGLPVPTSADSGKYLGVDSNGNFALISGSTPSGYSVEIYNNTGLDNVNIYDGQDNTGTYLGIVLMGNTETFTVSSGYIFAEWDDQYITDDITFAEDGSEIGNPVQVTSNMNLEVWDVEPIISYITFSSPSSFTLNVVDNKKYWNGTIEYSTNTTTWSTWSGTSAISSSSSGNTKYLYLRGTGNTYITGGSSSDTNGRWVLTGSNISCSGNIENLLDYVIVANGNHPIMATDCYAYMFYSCTSLTTPPTLPATELVSYCYNNMFRSCTSLTTPAKIAGGYTQATPAMRCCYLMYYGCTSLNIYTSSSGHTAFYKAMTYSTSTAPNYLSTYRMFYNCYIDGVKSRANYLTAGTQYYY